MGPTHVGTGPMEGNLRSWLSFSEVPSYLKELCALLIPFHYPVHSPISTFTQIWREGIRCLYVVSLSLHCPPWEPLMWYLQNFRHLLASLLSTASSWGWVTQFSQANDNELGLARGVWIWLTKTDVASREKKENDIFLRKRIILHKCFSLSTCRTHRSLRIPLVLALWMEKLRLHLGLHVLT